MTIKESLKKIYKAFSGGTESSSRSISGILNDISTVASGGSGGGGGLFKVTFSQEQDELVADKTIQEISQAYSANMNIVAVLNDPSGNILVPLFGVVSESGGFIFQYVYNSSIIKVLYLTDGISIERNSLAFNGFISISDNNGTLNATYGDILDMLSMGHTPYLEIVQYSNYHYFYPLANYDSSTRRITFGFYNDYHTYIADSLDDYPSAEVTTGQEI